jgi:cytochrome c-type biogenesis protein CcmE
MWKIGITVLAVGAAVAGAVYGSMRKEIELWKYPDEVSGALAGQRLNVGGRVAGLTADRKTLQYAFLIENRAPRPPATVPVRYHGLVPDTLHSGGEVVAIGRLTSAGVLEADTVMAKCPSKYEQR